jgi:hypothetical protein
MAPCALTILPDPDDLARGGADTLAGVDAVRRVLGGPPRVTQQPLSFCFPGGASLAHLVSLVERILSVVDGRRGVS